MRSFKLMSPYLIQIIISEVIGPQLSNLSKRQLDLPCYLELSSVLLLVLSKVEFIIITVLGPLMLKISLKF